jgi:hypothetical protein
LRYISTRLDSWEWLPSRGRSGGILFACNSNKFRIISSSKNRFSLDILIETRAYNKCRRMKIVYGLLDNSLQNSFWTELDNYNRDRDELWIVCGDFNAIRHRKDRSGLSNDSRISKQFNAFISNNNLIEHRLTTRRFTWSNGRQKKSQIVFIALW